jgi:hypothetical protein
VTPVRELLNMSTTVCIGGNAIASPPRPEGLPRRGGGRGRGFDRTAGPVRSTPCSSPPRPGVGRTRPGTGTPRPHRRHPQPVGPQRVRQMDAGRVRGHEGRPAALAVLDPEAATWSAGRHPGQDDVTGGGPVASRPGGASPGRSVWRWRGRRPGGLLWRGGRSRPADLTPRRHGPCVPTRGHCSG